MSFSVPNKSIGFDEERSLAGPFSGSFQTIGTRLAVNPIIVVFDNQSTVTVQISLDGSTVWKTFASGEAMVLDLQANAGQMDKNIQFYVKGTGGTGSFYIAIVYDR
jgi:hypothetical protein